MAELLPVDPPEGWTPRWSRAAEDASLDAMAAALERAGDRAEELTGALADAGLDGDGDAELDGDASGDADGLGDGGPGRIAAPQAGAWVWFGRECRFELDDHRRAVETTMPGHHRTKAATNAASAAVDFAEALCEPSGAFPFDVVTRQFGPGLGDSVAIEHGKPAGQRVTLGRGEVTERDPEGSIVVEREMTGGGTYDALGVERRAGDVARTTFVEGRWWYATVYEGTDGTRRGTYVNVCTPVEIFPGAVRYVDLHVDVVKTPDGEVRRVDDDELDAAVEAGLVSEPLAERAREVATSIESAL
jgi:Ribonuclease G/E